MLERLKAGQAKDITPILREIDRRIRLAMTSENFTGDYARSKRLLDGISAMISEQLAKFEHGLIVNLKKLAVSESIFEARALTFAVENDLFEAAIPAKATVEAAIFSAPLSVRGADGGKLLEPFIKDWSKAQTDNLVGVIRQGIFEGQTNQEIMVAVRGTAPASFRNGSLAVVKRRTEAMVRTAVQHVSSVSRMATYEENSDLVKLYQWVSTLDNKTTPICQSLDGRQWRVGEGPQPPAHINCRSTTVPVLDERFDFLKKGATRSSADGYVNAKESYYSWLKRQPQKFQEKAIGKTYAKLLRDGGLDSTQFAKLRLNRNFQPLTLEEMQKIEPLAFAKAGIKLNPATGSPISGR